MGRTFLLTMDLEEFERASVEDRFRISREGLDAFVPLVERLGIPVTFFTTASFARRYPGTVRELVETHEIALHALEHTDNYRTMGEMEARERLTEARNVLEGIIGNGYNITGFRAPQMQAPRIEVLEKVGIRYDSSLHPTFVPGRYSHHHEPMDIHRQGNIVRIPVSVTPLLRQAYSWIWFRALGVPYVRWNTRMTERRLPFVTIYFHPWDFRDLRRVPGIGSLYARNTHRSVAMLEKYLVWLKERGYHFGTMGGYLRETGWLE